MAVDSDEDKDIDKDFGAKKPARQLSSMSKAEKERYDSAVRARQEEAGRESIGSVQRRYGLESKPVGTLAEQSFYPMEKKFAPTTVPETDETRLLSRELAERYKQFHSAPASLKGYFADQIKKIESEMNPARQVLSVSDTFNPNK